LQYYVNSGSCETCKIHYIGEFIAGHGDDDYVYASPEWIENNVLRYLSSEIDTEVVKLSYEDM
jgi:hypothetical protein